MFVILILSINLRRLGSNASAKYPQFYYILLIHQLFGNIDRIVNYTAWGSFKKVLQQLFSILNIM